MLGRAPMSVCLEGVTVRAGMVVAGTRGGGVNYVNKINGSYSFCIVDNNGLFYSTGTMGVENMKKKGELVIGPAPKMGE